MSAIFHVILFWPATGHNIIWHNWALPLSWSENIVTFHYRAHAYTVHCHSLRTFRVGGWEDRSGLVWGESLRKHLNFSTVSKAQAKTPSLYEIYSKASALTSARAQFLSFVFDFMMPTPISQVPTDSWLCVLLPSEIISTSIHPAWMYISICPCKMRNLKHLSQRLNTWWDFCFRHHIFYALLWFMWFTSVTQQWKYIL